MLSVNDSLSEKERKKNDYNCCSKPQEGCGHVFVAHLDCIWKSSGHTTCLNINGKTATVRDNSSDQREGWQRLQMYTEPNPSCSTLINLISVASNDS